MDLLSLLAAYSLVTSANQSVGLADMSCSDLGVIERGVGGAEIEAVACLERDELTFVLTMERQGRAPRDLWLRGFGPSRLSHQDGERQVFEYLAGQGPIDLEWDGAASPLVIGDFDGDGVDTLAVGAFRQEPTLILFNLTDDPHEFLGQLFFSHAEGFGDTPYLRSRGVSRFLLGDPIILCDGFGRVRHYRARSQYAYALSSDSGETAFDCSGL